MNDNEPTVTKLRPGTRDWKGMPEELVMDASACRKRAIADLQEASTMPTAKARRVLESSAAIWGARAAQFDRIEDPSAETDPLTEG